MRPYRVTIEDWFAEIEAENEQRARAIGIQAFRETFPSKLTYRFLYGISRARVLENRKFTASVIDVKGIAEEDKQHFTGFWEGDGSLGYNSNGTPVLTLSQKEPQILEYIKARFNLSENLYPSKEGRCGALMVSQKAHVIPLLGVISGYVVSPQRVKQVNRVLGIGDAIEHGPTWAWLAGFADAEGCWSYCGGSLQLSIAQKDTEVLYKIKEFTGSGWVSGNNGTSLLSWSGDNAWRVTEQMYKYLRNPRKTESIYALSVFFGKQEVRHPGL